MIDQGVKGRKGIDWGVSGHYVYIVFDVRGIPRYVGAGSGTRWRKTPVRVDRLRKYRDEAGSTFNVPVAIVRDGMTRDEAYELERALVQIIGRESTGDGPLLNFDDGKWHRPKTVEKIRAAHRGKVFTPERRAAMSAVRRGKKKGPMPASHRAAIAAGLKGKPFTAERRAKISAAKVGKKLSAEHRAAIRAGHRRRKKVPPS